MEPSDSSSREAVPPSSATSTPHGSSIGHLLRGVLQSVKTRRKRSERDKFLRTLEKSGVDFAAALLQQPSSQSQRSTETSMSTCSLSLSLSFNTSRLSQAPTITTRRGEDAMRILDRIEKLQVPTTAENVRESVTLVTLRLVLASPQREAPLTQPQPQSQQLVLGKSAVVVICIGGTRSQLQQQQRIHELTRPFDDFRRLRKMLAFCVRRGRHEGENEDHEGKAEPLKATCAYCSDVRAYVAQCWERPPLLETSMLSSMCVIRRGVLGSSLMHFVRLAKSSPVFPHQRVGFSSDIRSAAAAVSSTPAADDNESPTVAPMCAAHPEIATILHDFLRLQRTRYDR
ncbi:hypothetical protein Gpo141_00009078 [Globisporangium polare]